MEIKELLEIMLNNVNEGREATHGLIGYNGVISVHNPEQVHRKPHTYITFDEFREIRNTPDHNTAHYRLNLAIEKLMVVTPVAPVMPAVFPIPNGYYVDDLKIPTYQEMRGLGYSEHVLKMQGYLLPVQPVLPPVVMPFVVPQGYTWAKAPPEFYGKYRSDGWSDEQLISDGYLIPMAPYEPDRVFKPFIKWVNCECDQPWPDNNYIFTESQFSNIKNSEFRVKLVAELNKRLDGYNRLTNVVRAVSSARDTEYDVTAMEERVNKRLNEIYQKL